ncbi:MAG: MATE family efflux transporter, partial [Rhodobacteraceae bacterium]|nr:MATE family efflux transporter [Paracoccaceae bacterium]
DRGLLCRSAVMASIWGCGLAIRLGLGFWLAGPWLIDTMAKAPEVQQAARIYLPWVALAPVAGAAAWMLDGIFIGATRTRQMRNAMLVSVLIYGMALAILLPAFGNHGLWAALMVLNVARGITLFIRYPALERDVTPQPA